MPNPLAPRIRLACRVMSWVALSLFAPAGFARDLAFSDPANTPPPPPGAIGFPNRAANFDVAPGFRQPPPGYGTVPFYWWLGDPLSAERLRWQA